MAETTGDGVADNRGERRSAEKAIFTDCAFKGCGRRFRRRQSVGRPRLYCQVACRRRAQYRRDLAAAGVGQPRSGLMHGPNSRGTARARDGQRLFGQALRSLLWFNGMTVRELADLAQIRPARVRVILDGGTVPSWPTTFMVVTLMRGSPDDVRWLWEWAQGQEPRRPASPTEAMHLFRAALRGLRLASAPGAEARGETTTRLLLDQSSSGVLEDWALTTGIGVGAERIRPLWEQARRAALCTPGFISPDEDGDGAEVE